MPFIINFSLTYYVINAALENHFLHYMPSRSPVLYYLVVRLDLKNGSFAVTRPTQLWKCQLKIFYLASKSKKIFVWVKKIVNKMYMQYG